MSHISGTFEALAKKGDGAYIPYVCAGDMGYEFTLQLVRTLSSSGADIIELGLPFSDPVADGPTIQGAMKRSLEAGFRVADIFRMIEEIRSNGAEQPIVLMTYLNPVEKMGVAKFCNRLAASGGDAMLVVDLPPEESSELDEAARMNSLDVIRLVAPSTSDGRLGEIVSRTTGFVYAVSVAGVTGERSGLPETALPLIRRVKSRTTLPVALGFGVSKPEHALLAFGAGASGVVEGSALVSIYESSPHEALAHVSEHAAAMKRAITRLSAGSPSQRP